MSKSLPGTRYPSCPAYSRSVQRFLSKTDPCLLQNLATSYASISSRPSQGKRLKRRKCCKPRQSASCPNRLSLIAKPIARRVATTLQNHSEILQSDRIDKLLQLIRNIRADSLRPHCHYGPRCGTSYRRRRNSCSKSQLKSSGSEDNWFSETASRLIYAGILYLIRQQKEITSERIPRIASKIYDGMGIEGLCRCSLVGQHFMALLMKLATVIDVKLMPYKSDVKPFEEKRFGPYKCGQEAKHCIFDLNRFNRVTDGGRMCVTTTLKKPQSKKCFRRRYRKTPLGDAYVDSDKSGVKKCWNCCWKKALPGTSADLDSDEGDKGDEGDEGDERDERDEGTKRKLVGFTKETAANKKQSITRFIRKLSAYPTAVSMDSDDGESDEGDEGSKGNERDEGTERKRVGFTKEAIANKNQSISRFAQAMIPYPSTVNIDSEGGEAGAEQKRVEFTRDTKGNQDREMMTFVRKYRDSAYLGTHLELDEGEETGENQQVAFTKDTKDNHGTLRKYRKTPLLSTEDVDSFRRLLGQTSFPSNETYDGLDGEEIEWPDEEMDEMDEESWQLTSTSSTTLGCKQCECTANLKFTPDNLHQIIHRLYFNGYEEHFYIQKLYSINNCRYASTNGQVVTFCPKDLPNGARSVLRKIRHVIITEVGEIFERIIDEVPVLDPKYIWTEERFIIEMDGGSIPVLIQTIFRCTCSSVAQKSCQTDVAHQNRSIQKVSYADKIAEIDKDDKKCTCSAMEDFGCQKQATQVDKSTVCAESVKSSSESFDSQDPQGPSKDSSTHTNRKIESFRYSRSEYLPPGFYNETTSASDGSFQGEDVQGRLAVDLGNPEEKLLYFHPANTSSRVEWCIYVSWLSEFEKNIATYQECLASVRRNVIKYGNTTDIARNIQRVLNNWGKYLKESRAVEQKLIAYFRSKAVTHCMDCRECTIDDYPAQHALADVVREAIASAKIWRHRLIAANHVCTLLVEEVQYAEQANDLETCSETVLERKVCSQIWDFPKSRSSACVCCKCWTRSRRNSGRRSVQREEEVMLMANVKNRCEDVCQILDWSSGGSSRDSFIVIDV